MHTQETGWFPIDLVNPSGEKVRAFRRCRIVPGARSGRLSSAAELSFLYQLRDGTPLLLAGATEVEGWRHPKTGELLRLVGT